MKNSRFYQVFLEYIQDLYDAEQQIVISLPAMIQAATNDELKSGFTEHLGETKEQVKRLERIFNLLGEQPKAKTCQAMKGLIAEGKEILQKSGLTPAVRDCFIIICAQKIEHYEISAYGSAYALAKHIQAVSSDKQIFKEICKLFDETLQEEGHADKKLTKVAEGKLFFNGVNDELEEELKAYKF